LFATLKLDNIDPVTQNPTSATCNGTGSGTIASPWMNSTSCTLPFGSRINIESFSHYTVTAADFNLPLHKLTDDGTLTWGDNCDDPAATGNTNCNPTPPPVGAGSSALINNPTTNTTTAIHDAAHATVTTVEVGTTVHDFVTVSGQPGLPTPT